MNRVGVAAGRVVALIIWKNADARRAEIPVVHGKGYVRDRANLVVA